MLKNLSRMKHALMEWAIKERIFDDRGLRANGTKTYVKNVIY